MREVVDGTPFCAQRQQSLIKERVPGAFLSFALTYREPPRTVAKPNDADDGGKIAPVFPRFA